MTQQARALALQCQFSAAHELLDHVDRETSGAARVRPALRSMLERGRVLNGADEVGAARELFLDAWRLARESGEDGLAVDAAHLLALASAAQPDVALDWSSRALKLAESSPAPEARHRLGALYNSMGWAYFDQAAYSRALDVFERAVEWRRSRPAVEPLLFARWSVGRTLRALGRTEEAFAIQAEVLRGYERNELAPSGDVYEELAECTRALGKPGHGTLFRQAHSILSLDEWLVEREPERLARLLSLSQER